MKINKTGMNDKIFKPLKKGKIGVASEGCTNSTASSLELQALFNLLLLITMLLKKTKSCPKCKKAKGNTQLMI